MKYYDIQKRRQEDLITGIFADDTGKSGSSRKISHILNDGKNNLYKDIRGSAPEYFKKNKIQWHTLENKDDSGLPTNTLESQVSCLNHLFPIRKDKTAVLKIVNGIIEGKQGYFKEVLPLCCDTEEEEPNYIAFEVVTKDNCLGEGATTRGANHTSIDALICAKDVDEKIWIIPIEWKHIERKDEEDEATEISKGRYDKFIVSSKYLRQKNYEGVYYNGDYYQLMRQTLWAEQMIEKKEVIAKNNKKEVSANDFFHLHIVPEGNIEFLRGGELEKKWRDCLTVDGNARYRIMDPKELFKPIVENRTLAGKGRYANLISYLRIRYW